MDRSELLELWNDMWKEGNWVPSWPDSLAGLNAETAAWTPQTPLILAATTGTQTVTLDAGSGTTFFVRVSIAP